MNQAAMRDSELDFPPRATVRPASIAPTVEERRILVLAPTGNDAALTLGFVQSAGMEGAVCVTMADLTHQISHGCGAIMGSEETL